jgi:hypothetical protein
LRAADDIGVFSWPRPVAKKEKGMSAAYSAMLTRSCVWTFSLLALIGLAACGAADEGAAAATPIRAAEPTATIAQSQASVVAADAPTKSIQSTGLPTAPDRPTDQLTALAAPAKPSPAPLPPELLNPTEVPALVPSVPPALPTVAVAHSGDWQPYRNDQAGYSVTYPSDWTVSETVGADGSYSTTFTPADGGAGILVLVQAGEQSGESNDIPNTRCQPVTVGGLTGMRCLDTISFSTSTILVGHGKTYTIVATGKRTDQTIYQALIDSFAVSS